MHLLAWSICASMLPERSERDKEWVEEGTSHLRKMRKGRSVENVKKNEVGSYEEVRKNNGLGAFSNTH